MKFLHKIYTAFFARNLFFKLNRLLYSLSLRGMGVLNFESDTCSGELKFIQKYLPRMKNPIVFDVGANEGNYARLVRAYSKDAVIYCFEPHPATFKKLVENNKDLNTNNHNFAVGSKAETLVLYDYAASDGSSHASLYQEVLESIHKAETVKHDIPVIALDEFVSSHKIHKIDLLKIDTEGHELEVLKGLTSLISAKKIAMIHFEFNEMNVASRVYFKDFWDMLSAYDLYRMLPNSLVKIETYNPIFCEIFAYQNIVAILKEAS